MTLALHIPDGFLSTGVATALWIPAIITVAIALRVADRELDDERAPLVGVLAAFIFATQMLNFPVPGGTSGHLLGATLAAILLGPWIGSLVMAVVIGGQALMFADGGLTALGANVTNMGILGALLAGGLLHLLLGRRDALSHGAYLGAIAGCAWLAVMVGATATSFELAISGTVGLGPVLVAMLSAHAAIGIGEALITVAAVGLVLASRPDLLAYRPRSEPVRAPAGVAGVAS